MTRRPALAFETSTRSPSLALETDDGRVERATLDAGGSHASDLAPAAEALLRSAGLAPSDLRQLVVGIGPGSLTGLRVGAATAIGLARVVGAELLGVPSIAAGALAARDVGARGALVCVHDLRGGHVALAGFEALEQDASPLREAPLPGGEASLRPVPYAELPAALVALRDRTLIGDGELLERLACAEADRARAQPPEPPSAAALLRLRSLGRPDDVQPLYLRAFGS